MSIFMSDPVPLNTERLILDKMGSHLSSVSLCFKLTGAILVLLFMVVCLPGTSLSADEATDQEINQQKNRYVNAEITIKIIPSANNTFGYDILLYGRPLVHQPTIPGLPGNEGFTTKKRAQTR